ncbi:MAG: 23S rRNA (guanosine(2251)-2'-O)-methyltransferase RlmB [Clostridia bacterium]
MIIYGKNPIKEAILAEKTINKIYIQKGLKDVSDIILLAKENKLVVVESDKFKLDKLTEGKSHQGLVALVTDFIYSEVDELIEDTSVIVVLDKIEDPHNLGAIIRTVECLGASGVVIQKRNSAQVTDTVEKVSAGAINYVKVARVINITETIKYLKQKGYWIYGMDMDGSDITKVEFDKKTVLVIGNEGEGISRLVKENCDFLVKINMTGKINSLNASVSAAIGINEIVSKR